MSALGLIDDLAQGRQSGGWPQNCAGTASGPGPVRSACIKEPVSPRRRGSRLGSRLRGRTQKRGLGLRWQACPGDHSFNVHHPPGEGRGPIGEVVVTTRISQLATFPSWAPAFAGVVPGDREAAQRRGRLVGSYRVIVSPRYLPCKGKRRRTGRRRRGRTRNRGFPFLPLRLASANHLPLAGEDRSVVVRKSACVYR